jgi:hypothetical protein
VATCLVAIFGIIMVSLLPGRDAGATPVGPLVKSPHQALLATLADPGAVGTDEFGYSVAVSGRTAVVGTPRANCNNRCPGAAYIYTEGASGWPTTPTVTLNDPGFGTSDAFGTSVALAGMTVVVGAIDTGYLYVEGNSGWSTTPTATLNDPVPNVNPNSPNDFGRAVAVSATTVVVGAPGSNTSGAAYVYVKGSTGWPTTPTKTLRQPKTTALGGFGSAVAVSGSTALVGTPSGAGSGRPGVTYVYTRGLAAWPKRPSAVLRDPAANASDDFGSAVSVSGTTAAVGAYGANSYSGDAYLYTAGPSGWSSVTPVALQNPGSVGFGHSVAVTGSQAVVGATFFGNPYSGAAYVYVKKASGFSPTPNVILSNPVPQPAESFFGSSVAVSGKTTIIGDDGLNGQAGGAYLYGS